MTLDEPTWRQMARADRDYYREQARIEAEQLRATESVEAEEAKWQGIFARMTLERAKEHHPFRYIDTRCFDVDGLTPADGHDW